MIKACKDNKFSSFTGEFITSINPENLIIKSGVGYHTPQSMTGAALLQYRGTPPRLLAFSLLFDNTGIIPGSNTIAVVEQVKQLQAIAYDVQKKNNTPNYIRVVWGQIDFKGRLVDLEITYSMFQMDGTLVRAEAKITVLEEIPIVGQGKYAAGKDSEYAKASGASATGNNHRGTQSSSVGANEEEAFAQTPDGINGAYSGAPNGAYEGGPDTVYHGAESSNTGLGAASSPGDGMHTSANQGPNSNNAVAWSGGGTNNMARGGNGAGTNNMAGGDGTGTKVNHHSRGNTMGSNAAGGGNASGINSGGGTAAGAYSNGGNAGNSKGQIGQAGGQAGGGLGGQAVGGLGGQAIGSDVASSKNGKNFFLVGGGLDSLKDQAKSLEKPKLSLWQKLKLAAKRVAPKTYDAIKTQTKKL